MSNRAHGIGPATRRASTLLFILFGSAGCAEDRILPAINGCEGDDCAQANGCGDGRLDSGEECDNASAGCQSCKIADGWTCAGPTCSEICGDGLEVGAEECDPPDGVTCDTSCRNYDGARPDCSMDGYWMVRQTDFSRDTAISALQASSNWYVYRFEQSGDSFTTVQSLYCGVEVTGTVTVRPRPAGYRALLYSNAADGSTWRGTRSGTFKAGSEFCEFEMDRWYVVRGLTDAMLPTQFSDKLDLEDLPPLPYEEKPLEPTGAHLEGALDVDGDERPGFAWQLSGNVTGVRHTVQRDWNEYTTDSARWPITKGAIEFTTRSRFDNEERVLAVQDCGQACPFLATGSVPSPGEKSRVTFRFLGSELDEPRVSEIIQSSLYKDADQDMATCKKVRTALPHQDKPEDKP